MYTLHPSSGLSLLLEHDETGQGKQVPQLNLLPEETKAGH